MYLLTGGSATSSSPTSSQVIAALSGQDLGVLQILLSGNVSAATWGTNGIGLRDSARTLTDTSGAGTVAAGYTNVLRGNTIAASNTRTFTDYATLFLAAPTAGTNVTITNAWSLWLSGNSRVVMERLDAGSRTNPALQFNDVNSGFYRPATGWVGVACNTTSSMQWANTTVLMTSGCIFGWTNQLSDPSQSGVHDTAMRRSAPGIIGINSSSTNGGSFGAAAGVSNTTITSNVTNLALDASRFQRVTGASTPVLTGIAPPTGGLHVAGNQRWIYNVGATSIQVNHNDSTTTATVGGAVASSANRLFFQGAANITLAQNECLFIEYDATDNGSGAAGWRARKLSN